MIHYTDRIFVAGHTEMVGSAIVRRLIRLGHPRSHIITRTSAELDLFNQAAIQAFLTYEKPDHVYLTAAQGFGITSFQAQPPCHNSVIQANVVNAAFHAGVKKLLLVASSNSSASTTQPLVAKDLLRGPVNSLPLGTRIPHADCLTLCESYNQQYSESHGVDYRCVVSCTVYGPGDSYDPAHSQVIPELIRRCHDALRQGSLSVLVACSGSARGEFIFVDDLADACVYLMELSTAAFGQQTQPTRRCVNVGVGTDVNMQTLAQLVASAVGYTGKLDFDDTRGLLPARALLDCSRLKSLGWEPLMDLETGLELSFMDFRLRLHNQC